MTRSLIVRQCIQLLVKLQCIHLVIKLRGFYRRQTRHFRTLPDFIVIGAQKAGTTSLYNYLSQHPQIRPSFLKEVGFFDGGLDPQVDNFAMGLSWYRSHFPLKIAIRKSQAVFEASPNYLFNPRTAERIHNTLPHVKLIVLLRNPVERTISNYFHETRKKREPLSIESAFRAEEKRISTVLKTKDYKSTDYINWSYKGRSRYAEQLIRYFHCFPRDQILIIQSESLFGNPDKALEQICYFIGVEPHYKFKDLKARNMGKNRKEVDPTIHELLNDYFQPHNRALNALLDEKMDW